LIGVGLILTLIFFVYNTGHKNGVNKCELAIAEHRLQEQKRQAADEAKRKIEVEKQMRELTNYEDGTLAPVLRYTLDGMRERHAPDSAPANTQ